MAYRPIPDWSPEGRREIVDRHEVEMVAILEEAFTNFMDEPASSLAAYGFEGDDPVMEAAKWALGRFRDGELDSERINSEDRSFRIFTRVNFWLTQKVGILAFRRLHGVKARIQNGGEAATELATQGSVVVEREAPLAVVQVLRRLANQTCASMVGFWLQGTEKMRSHWFDWQVKTPAPPADLSPKDRSLSVADALFRFAVLFTSLVPKGDDPAAKACLLTWFSPCEDRHPYRVSEAVVAKQLSLESPRAAERLRHKGMVELIRIVLSAAERTVEVRVRDVDGAILRSSLRKGLLNAYKIEDSEITRRLEILPREK
jgi:hypothetical protein